MGASLRGGFRSSVVCGGAGSVRVSEEFVNTLGSAEEINECR